MGPRRWRLQRRGGLWQRGDLAYGSLRESVVVKDGLAGDTMRQNVGNYKPL